MQGSRFLRAYSTLLVLFFAALPLFSQTATKSSLSSNDTDANTGTVIATTSDAAGTATAAPAPKAVPKPALRKKTVRKRVVSKSSAANSLRKAGVSKTLATTTAKPLPTKLSATSSASPPSAARTARSRTIASTSKRKAAAAEPAVANDFGDDTSKDDPVVRAAALHALGKLSGAMVVVDPTSGRILTVVNQKLAYESGYQPCSSFKPAVALAAMAEGIIDDKRNRIALGKRWYLNLEQALAISNNLYFEHLGRALGLEKLQEYARRFGFGEHAGIGIETEPQGSLPRQAPPPRQGGVGKIASFGQGISVTLLQLVSFTSALANGGTLYYLQYGEQPDTFQPKVKRVLDITQWLPAIRQGMEEAVLSGTARRARQDDVAVLGKTGTCSQNGLHLGWFTGYNDEPGGVAVAVLLRTKQNVGGGPRASQVAGEFFRTLESQKYFASRAVEHAAASAALPASIQLPGMQ